MRPAVSPQALQRCHQLAIQLLNDGYPPVAVVSLLKVDRRSVRRWRAALRQQGPMALQARPAPGRPPKLSYRDKTRLEKLLLKGAAAAGFPTDLWTWWRIAQTNEEHFGARYRGDHIRHLMRAMGWSSQKPTRRALERDQAVIAN